MRGIHGGCHGHSDCAQGDFAMMLRLFANLLILVSAATLVRAQEVPKPGPEHELFKELAGDWDVTLKMPMVGEVKGKATYKIDFGGFLLVEEFAADFGGAPFKGRGQTSYCPIRKKYVATWVDSMGPSPIVMQGTFDKATKTMTEEGEGPGMTGKIAKLKTTGVLKDKDTFLFTIYEVQDGKDVEMLSITYKRKM
jgi:hypothetical protein